MRSDGLSYTRRLRLYCGRCKWFAPPSKDAHAHEGQIVTFVSNPAGDFDGDGLSNDYERIWGLNPTNAVSKNPFTFGASLKSGIFSYTRRDPALTGLSYTVWTSTNLLNWAQDAGAIQSPGVPVNQIQSVSVTVSPALLTSQRLFMRVRAQ